MVEGRLCCWPWSSAWLPSPMMISNTGLLVCNTVFLLREESTGEEGNQFLGQAGLQYWGEAALQRECLQGMLDVVLLLLSTFR